jgi:hypothetical protein
MPTIAPSHKAIAQYYAELAQYDSHGVAHELARALADAVDLLAAVGVGVGEAAEVGVVD